jgi:hypothetical protein
MRVLAASFLLLLHLQPLAGAALCLALSGAKPEEMEAGCPMPERSEKQPSVPFAAGPTLSAGLITDPAHGCIFSETCNTSPNTVRPVRLAVLSFPPHEESVLWPLTPGLSIQQPSPPVPPPRA